MEKPPFQFRLSYLLLIVMAIALWIAVASITSSRQAPPLHIWVLIFAGIAGALNRLFTRIFARQPFGLAISLITTPIIAVSALVLALILSTFGY
jgi:amino acid permease